MMKRVDERRVGTSVSLRLFPDSQSLISAQFFGGQVVSNSSCSVKYSFALTQLSSIRHSPRVRAPQPAESRTKSMNQIPMEQRTSENSGVISQELEIDVELG